MAFKSGGFPSPQLIFIKTDSISLDKFLQIRHLAIEQGDYITSITDTNGKVGEQVLRIIHQHRPRSSFHRAVRQIEQERTQINARASLPPTKSPRLHEPDNQQEVGEDNLFDEIVEEGESEDEVDSEVSATFDRLNTGIKNEPTGEREFPISSHTVTQPSETHQPDNSQNEGDPSENERGRTPFLSPSKREPEISQGEEEMDLSDSNNIRGVSKLGRRVKQTQFYGFQVDSNMSGIFFSDHDTTDLDRNNKVLETDAEMNPDLLLRSRVEELRGWRSNDVYTEVARDKLPRGTKSSMSDGSTPGKVDQWAPSSLNQDVW